MQDYNYWHFGTLEITIELSCCQWPSDEQMSKLFEDNKRPLINFLKQANTGVRGQVKFANGIIAQQVGVQIDAREPITKTNKMGEFHKILLPGKYNLSLSIMCERVYWVMIEITATNKLIRNDITLSNEIYQLYQTHQAHLDDETLFCTKEFQPVPCERPPYKSTAASSSSMAFSFLHLAIWLFVALVRF